MPSDSTTLEDEGVVIPPTRIVHAGAVDQQALAGLLEQMRNPRERSADLRAQLAAGSAGAARFAELVERFGLEAVREGMSETLDYAERRTRARIADMPDGEHTATDFLEAAHGDLELRLTATVAGDEITLDFTGSAGQHEGNLNCPLAVTTSACYFAVRVLTDPDVPPCAGAYRPVRVIAPEGSLLNARPPAAVVAGNVETSSRIADCLLRAFGKAVDAPAQGQGTMNNLTFGSPTFTYYETIGGGQGASRDGPGPSAVHVAMSNTLNTPVEALEAAYPLRVERYALRAGSGGAGRYPGGDGVVRALTVLEHCQASILSDRRRHAPRGAAGGGDGKPGSNRVNQRKLGAKARITLEPGDTITIRTPGGGGYGRA
jgi:N-methylhydantoinase B